MSNEVGHVDLAGLEVVVEDFLPVEVDWRLTVSDESDSLLCNRVSILASSHIVWTYPSEHQC